MNTTPDHDPAGTDSVDRLRLRGGVELLARSLMDYTNTVKRISQPAFPDEATDRYR